MKKSLYVFIIGLWVLNGCESRSKPIKDVSFYHWKQKYQPTNYEVDILKQLHVNTLYIKFFDVKWSEGFPAPVADVSFAEKPFCEIVPTVFITNEVMLKTKDAAVDSLAVFVHDRIVGILNSNMIKNVKEIQFDCDWTPKSKDSFFRFLSKVKELTDSEVSSTLRLYQLKYHYLAGVPPVFKVNLMCYNMLAPQDYKTQNSIYTLNELKKYTENIDQYPLKVNIAMPLFAWACVFRKEEFVGFINEVRKSEIDKENSFKNISGNMYRCEKTVKFKGSIVRKGDEIRVEEVDEKELKAGVDFLTRKLNNDNVQLIYYHLDSTILKIHEKDIRSISDFN